jgi:hypothetical protein
MKRRVDFSSVKCLCASFSGLPTLSYVSECLKNVFMLRQAEKISKCKKMGQGASPAEMALGQWGMWKLVSERG